MDHDTMRAFSMILQIGISVLVPVFLCLAVGLWLDQKWGAGWTIPLLILGFLAGGRNAWILAKKTAESQKKRQEEETYDLMGMWREEEKDGEEK